MVQVARIRDELMSIQCLNTLEREHLDDALAWVDSGAGLCRPAEIRGTVRDGDPPAGLQRDTYQ